MCLRITPQPTPQEQAAIEAAIARLLIVQTPNGGPRLRFGDASSAVRLRAWLERRALSWADAARIEALGLFEASGPDEG